MKISIFSLIFSNRNIEESIKLAKEIGYDGVELLGADPHLSSDMTIEKVKELGKISEYYGVEFPAIASYIGNFSTISDNECNKQMDELEKYFCIMDTLKCNLIRVGCGGPNTFLAREYHYNKALYWMNRCADLANQYNKKIVMEIHNGSLIETVEAADKFIKDLSRDNIGLIHDAGNMYITDTDYGINSVKVLGDKIFHVHVKDELRVDDDTLPASFHNRTIYGDEIFQQKLLGEGAVDHVPLFKGLLKVGYNGFLSCECHAAIPDIEKAKHELAEIKMQIKIAENELINEKRNIAI